jgi:membrane-bound serine protease (ClpP class)
MRQSLPYYALRFILPLFLWLLLLPPVLAQSGELYVLEIDGPVTQAMATYFERGISMAEREGATAVLIILDTPGGDLTSTLDIVQHFRRAELPIIVYIAPPGAQAASAGSVITAAAHASGMAPETVIGAASPINSDGSDINETAYRKAVEDLKATMRSLTERRGEEAVAIAEAMIEDARAVNASEALEAGFIDVIALNREDLLAQLDGLVVTVSGEEVVLATAGLSQRDLPLSFSEQLLLLLTNPIVLGVLLTIGVQAIIIELSNPGGYAAGIIGLVCIALALYGFGQLPVNWLGLGFIILAFALFVGEAFTPTFGALSISGAVALLAGLLVLFNSPGNPEYIRISLVAAVTISALTAVLFVFIVYKAIRGQQATPITGREGLIGQSGPVRVPFASVTNKPPYTGQVLVTGQLWRAMADDPLEKGEWVVVTAISGLSLHVKRTGPSK